jgi:hypothetical protein
LSTVVDFHDRLTDQRIPPTYRRQKLVNHRVSTRLNRDRSLDRVTPTSAPASMRRLQSWATTCGCRRLKTSSWEQAILPGLQSRHQRLRLTSRVAIAAGLRPGTKDAKHANEDESLRLALQWSSPAMSTLSYLRPGRRCSSDSALARWFNFENHIARIHLATHLLRSITGAACRHSLSIDCHHTHLEVPAEGVSAMTSSVIDDVVFSVWSDMSTLYVGVDIDRIHRHYRMSRQRS